MADMTASETRIFILQQLKELSGPEGCCVQTMQRNQTKRNNLRALAALIQQQAQTIAELQTEITYQNKQIARLQEDLSRQIGGKP